jgi:hypothetical protein
MVIAYFKIHFQILPGVTKRKPHVFSKDTESPDQELRSVNSSSVFFNLIIFNLITLTIPGKEV